MALALAAFLLLVGSLAAYRRLGHPQPETVRKLLHTGSGLLTLSFPFLFDELWPVLLLTGASATLVAIMKFVPAVRRRLGGSPTDVGRTTLGEIYFPISVAVVFWLSAGESLLLFVIPILVLTLADATCALVGARYGQSRYEGAQKSLEGSVSFVAVAFLCIHVPLLLWSDVGRAESLLIASTLALVVMLLEGSAWRGLDNLFIPIGGYFILSVYLTLDAAALGARFLITLGLVAAVLLSRRTTTLADDALLAGAFFCYIVWAVAGWRWLLPPLIVYAGYSWISPRTPANSQRVHAIGVVLAVCAATVPWVVAAARGVSDVMFPYTLGFAAHLAIFGVSRLASDDPDRPLRPAMARAIMTSWGLLFLPYLAISRPWPRHLVLASLALLVLAVMTIAFVARSADIRNLPLTRRRWARQAAWTLGASLAGWLCVVVLGSGAP
jgi:phytol kinase